MLDIQTCRIPYILFKLEEIKKGRPYLRENMLLELFRHEWLSPFFHFYPSNLLVSLYYLKELFLLLCKHRRQYLSTAQKKKKTKKEIRIALRRQLQYLKRNIKHIHQLLSEYERIPFKRQQYKYLLVIQTLYDQQKYMYDHRVHSVEDRIVSIHQPHVRPIVRGKTNAAVEFGAKIQVALVNGIAFLDDLSWDAFNEGVRLQQSVENFKRRFGYYPREVLADRIYCTRENRKWLKNYDIKLRAKPLGRPSSNRALSIPVRPGERNPIEGKFGQAKAAYGMNRIKARLDTTSQSWIASIVLVLNLVNLIGEASLCVLMKLIAWLRQEHLRKNLNLCIPRT